MKYGLCWDQKHWDSAGDNFLFIWNPSGNSNAQVATGSVTDKTLPKNLALWKAKSRLIASIFVPFSDNEKGRKPKINDPQIDAKCPAQSKNGKNPYWKKTKSDRSIFLSFVSHSWRVRRPMRRQKMPPVFIVGGSGETKTSTFEAAFIVQLWKLGLRRPPRFTSKAATAAQPPFFDFIVAFFLLTLLQPFFSVPT